MCYICLFIIFLVCNTAKTIDALIATNASNHHTACPRESVSINISYVNGLEDAHIKNCSNPDIECFHCPRPIVLSDQPIDTQKYTNFTVLFTQINNITDEMDGKLEFVVAMSTVDTYVLQQVLADNTTYTSPDNKGKVQLLKNRQITFLVRNDNGALGIDLNVIREIWMMQNRVATVFEIDIRKSHIRRHTLLLNLCNVRYFLVYNVVVERGCFIQRQSTVNQTITESIKTAAATSTSGTGTQSVAPTHEEDKPVDIPLFIMTSVGIFCLCVLISLVVYCVRSEGQIYRLQHRLKIITITTMRKGKGQSKGMSSSYNTYSSG